VKLWVWHICPFKNNNHNLQNNNKITTHKKQATLLHVFGFLRDVLKTMPKIDW